MTILSSLKRDFAGYGSTPPTGRWPGGAKVALNFVVNIEEGSERSWEAGDGRNEGLGEVPRAVDPRYRDLGTESIYEYGSRAGVFRLLRLFAKQDVRFTAFAAAQALEVNPDAVELLLSGGHEICGHGYRWSEAWTMEEPEERASIAKAVETITNLTGSAPLGWYSRWMPSERTRALLVEHGGFLYDSDAYNDDIPYYTAVSGIPHLILPYSMIYNDTHFSYGHMASPADFVDYCSRGLRYLCSEQDSALRMMSVGVHPRLMGQAARASALEEFVSEARANPDVWIATREEIARWWWVNVPPHSDGQNHASPRDGSENKEGQANG